MDLIIISGLWLMILFGYHLWANHRINQKNIENIRLQEKEKIYQKQSDEFVIQIAEKKTLAQNNEEIKNKNVALQAELKEQKKFYEFIRSSKNQINTDFKQIANEILKQGKDDLGDKNQALLNPLQHDIKQFKERLEAINSEQIKEKATLTEQIRNLALANQETLRGAEKLTKALTYDNKQQGDWGEMQLELILQGSGLKENQEYHKQSTKTDGDGKIMRPDFIVHLPNGKDIIIDSKVSLKNYNDYINTKEFSALEKHIQSVDKHIKNISLKAYQELNNIHTLDFIFVFFPIEASLLVAIEKKPELFNDALKKNIALTSPSTLMMSLKVVNYIWDIEKQNKNTENVVRLAGNMYDKLVGIVSDLEFIERNLEKAQQSCQMANKKLRDGKGSIFSTADKIKSLGVSSKKQLT